MHVEALTICSGRRSLDSHSGLGTGFSKRNPPDRIRSIIYGAPRFLRPSLELLSNELPEGACLTEARPLCSFLPYAQFPALRSQPLLLTASERPSQTAVARSTMSIWAGDSLPRLRISFA